MRPAQFAVCQSAAVSASLGQLSAREMDGLRPPLQRRFAQAVEPVDATLGPLEPTIHVALQNTASLRRNYAKVAGAAWAGL